MNPENPDYEKIPSWLNTEQIEILEKITKILDDYAQDVHENKIPQDIMIEKSKKVVEFGNKLKKEGFFPKRYLLWHKVKHSTPHKSISEFDISDNRIEYFIRDTFSK